MKFTSDIAQRYFVGTSNQTSKLHFQLFQTVSNSTGEDVVFRT